MKYIKIKEEIDDVKQGILVFSAEWCGPCKMMSPIFEQLENNPELSTISFLKVDISASPDIARDFGVNSVPTILFIKDGKVVSSTTGVKPMPVLISNLKRLAGIE